MALPQRSPERLVSLGGSGLGVRRQFDVPRATKPGQLPVVLYRPEIERVYSQFIGPHRLIFAVMYGAGLRHQESEDCAARTFTAR